MEKISRRFALGVCHHKEGPYLKNDLFMPIHVGAAKATLRHVDWYRDDSGDNISEKNPSFCELTALYWMWKNVSADYYGLMHYRRFFNFNLGDHSSYSETSLAVGEKRYGWNVGHLEHICRDHDIFTSPFWNVHPVGLGHAVQTNYDFYAREHLSKDLDLVLDIIKADDRDIYHSCLDHIHGSRCNFANLTVMERRFFDQYCEWLFAILFEAEKHVDTSSYDKYQKRIWGFIAERLLGAYVNYLRQEQGARTGELGVVFLQSKAAVTDRSKAILQIQQQRRQKKEPSVDHASVVFAIDDNYAAHCGAALISLLANNTHIPSIDIYVLTGQPLSEDNAAKLLQIVDRYPSAHLTFLQVDESRFNLFPDNREHISKTTYYRLALHKLVPDHVSTILYLDADIIVEDKIDELLVGMDGYCIAASKDEGGTNQSRRLGLPVTHDYFNAGVAVFNLDEIRKLDIDTLYLEAFYKNRSAITLQDQDILNITFCDRMKTLDLRWNANARLYRMNDLERSYSDAEAQAAGTAPGIIHYTDVPKPWTPGCNHPLRNLYWHWRNQTPWALTAEQDLDFTEADLSSRLKKGSRIAWRKIKRRFR